jgi:hypothetical protein
MMFIAGQGMDCDLEDVEKLNQFLLKYTNGEDTVSGQKGKMGKILGKYSVYTHAPQGPGGNLLPGAAEIPLKDSLWEKCYIW